MSRKTYDPACLELARHFLADEPRLVDFHAEQLAARIQQAVEDWFDEETTSHLERQS